MPNTSKRYLVEVGDDHFFFPYGKEITEIQLQRTFEKWVEPYQSELFPGLKLRDEKGQLLKPKLKMKLVPSKE